MNRYLMVVGLISVIAVGGCSNSEPGDRFPERVEIRGFVSINGEPLTSGLIRFTSTKDRDNGSESFADIIDGQYVAHVTPGEKQVLIRSPKPIGKPDATGFVETKETLPARFNTRSTLDANITAENTTIDFDLVK